MLASFAAIAVIVGDVAAPANDPTAGGPQNHNEKTKVSQNET